MSQPDAQAGILLEMLESDTDSARLTAAKYLVDYPGDDVAAALAHAALEDPEPAVRDAAAVSLGQMGGQEGISLLVDAASDKGGARRAQAVHALALSQDAAPGGLVEVTGPLRRQVAVQLARIRFWRNWPRIRMVTLAGAIGGAICAAAGADFLCYVTPAEHLGLPTPQDVLDGVMASRIAAHAADIVKGVPGARNWDDKMSTARSEFDWERMTEMALDPGRVRTVRGERATRDPEACSMCGRAP